MNTSHNKHSVFFSGMRDGIPIGLGYFAVSFSLGIAARNAGFTVFQGFLLSLLNNTSAGEYAGIALVAAQATYLEVALITLITNARYFLMSCALSQKFAPGTKLFHKLIVGFDVTDEIFGIDISYPGYLPPQYQYGAMLMAIPCWAAGTALGIFMGNILPAVLVQALTVAIYGMFLAIIIPPAKTNRIILGAVTVSFMLSFLLTVIPWFAGLSEGMRTILLTVLISSAVAWLFPIPVDVNEKEQEAI